MTVFGSDLTVLNSCTYQTDLEQVASPEQAAERAGKYRALGLRK